VLALYLHVLSTCACGLSIAKLRLKLQHALLLNPEQRSHACAATGRQRQQRAASH
jgi:hypothetical protein